MIRIFEKSYLSLKNYIKPMRGLNKVTLIGNLGKEPEINTLEGGITVAKFSLATTESYRDKEGDIQSETERFAVVMA
jgi:single-strand DNA-binding protein